MMYTAMLLALAGLGLAQSSSSSSSLNPAFQTTPDILPGPTKTGAAPFLAETNAVFFGTSTFYPNSPLETAVPIVGATPGNSSQNIFQLFGQLSSYFPNPSGFGAEEYPLPPGANITQVSVLHRHGSRYPTNGSAVQNLGALLQTVTSNGSVQFNGSLSFLNSWKYKLGYEIMVPRGRQELFDSGVLHYYQYAQLYNPNGPKIVARTTTQNRMLESAEYFLAGFFGLDWTRNASIEPILETSTYIVNDTLAGYDNCNNSNTYLSVTGNNLTTAWGNTYLANATKRFQAMTTGMKWTPTEVYYVQQLCAYETVAFGYSQFCGLFTFTEWQGYEYSVDVNFYGDNMFGSPTGRAVGIGWVEELYARLRGIQPTSNGTSQLNTTLDSSSVTFPTDGGSQNLFFDFSHDTNIAAILTAFGLTQFNQTLTAAGPPANQQMIVSHMEPFGARLDIEVIKTPAPLLTHRPANLSAATNSSSYYVAGNSSATQYIHFLMNQRTIPLGKSYPQCGQRDDGWCEFNTFLDILSTKAAEAEYNFSCNGKYPAQNVTNGVPVTE